MLFEIQNVKVNLCFCEGLEYIVVMLEDYEKLNLIKKAHNLLSDLDTALVLKDIDYLIKLTKYIPVVKSKVVAITERQPRIVNEEVIVGRFGDHYFDYVKQ